MKKRRNRGIWKRTHVSCNWKSSYCRGGIGEKEVEHIDGGQAPSRWSGSNIEHWESPKRGGHNAMGQCQGTNRPGERNNSGDHILRGGKSPKGGASMPISSMTLISGRARISSKLNNLKTFLEIPDVLKCFPTSLPPTQIGAPFHISHSTEAPGHASKNLKSASFM